MSDQRKKPLPEWFVSPGPETKHSQQMSLFQISLKDMLARLRVSTDTISKWYAEGWVSINGSEDIILNEFDDPHVFEILFVRDVVRSGLSDAQIRHIFSMLPKPFAFNPKKITFSFKYGWVEVPPRNKPTSYIEDNLEAELDSGGPSRLKELRDWIDERLDGYNDLPYPESNLYWRPTDEDGDYLLTIQCPEGLEEIENLGHYLGILQINFQWMIQMSVEPESEIMWVLESLEEAGLANPELNPQSLVNGDYQEWTKLLMYPELEVKIASRLRGETFPLIPQSSQEAAELFQDISLTEWAQNMARCY